MGTVIRFPLEERIGHKAIGAGLEPATVVILPVIRIERHAEEPSGRAPPGRRQGPGAGPPGPPHAGVAGGGLASPPPPPRGRPGWLSPPPRRCEAPFLPFFFAGCVGASARPPPSFFGDQRPTTR